MDISGRSLDAWLQELLINHTGEYFTAACERGIVENIKEELCYVAQNFDEESKAAKGSSENDKPYTLPDKRVIKIGGFVRIACPENLFMPEINGRGGPSLQNMTWKSVQESDIDIRKQLC